MTRLSFLDLVEFSKTFPSQFPGVRPSPEALQYSLAAKVLRAFLGDEWCDRQLMGDSDAHDRFRWAGSDPLIRMKVPAWTVALAEMLFNLQHVTGFDERLGQILRDDLESAVAELESARLLSLSDIPFEFVQRTQIRGADYDIRATLPGGVEACCETKSKSETTALRDATIRNALKEAARQVPDSSPAICFLKLPECWIAKPELSGVVRRVLTQHFRNHRRVMTVILLWEEWIHLQCGSLGRLSKFREEVNYQSRFYDPKNVGILKSCDEQSSIRWKKFIDVVAELERQEVPWLTAPVSGDGRIGVQFSPQCLELMSQLKITPELVIETVNDRDHNLLSDRLDRMVTARWVTDDQIILVDSIVVRKMVEKDLKGAYINLVSARLVLALRPDLPAGRVDRGMDMQEFLPVVASSFGHLVCCHPEERSSTLYSGRWDGKAPRVESSSKGSILYMSGSFYPAENSCELVWAFNSDRYRGWVNERNSDLTQI